MKINVDPQTKFPGKFFMGSGKYLRDISRNVSLPVLRKDFIIDPYQIYETKCLGASAYLLIVDCLEPTQLRDFIQLGEKLGITAFVEVHRPSEVKIAVESGAKIIGINNRNLRTFKTSLQTSFKLRPLIPHNITVVSESGINTSEDIKKLREHDIQYFQRPS